MSCTIFNRKDTPWVYLLLTNGTPFTYLVYNLASLLTAVNVRSFKYEKKSQTRTVSRLFFYSHTMLLFLFTNRNDRFPNPFIYLKPEKGTGQNSSEKLILLSRRISLTGLFGVLVSALRFKCKENRRSYGRN